MKFADKIDTIFEDLETIEARSDVLPTLLDEFPGLPKYLSGFGVNVSELYPLGAGCQGTAYSDGKFVVKFTEDTQEVKASARLMEKPVKGVNPIIHVGTFARPILWHKGIFSIEGRESQFYVIIQDLQDTNLTPEEKVIAKAVGDFLVEFYHREESPRHKQGEGLLALLDKVPPTEKNMSGLTKSLAQVALKKGQVPITVASLMIAQKLFEAVINLQTQAGIRFFDVGPGNIAKDRDGNYVLIDIGVSQTKGRVPAYGVIESKVKDLRAELLNYGLEIVN